MAILEIKTADELMDQDLEARWRIRRAARQTDVFQRILRAFVERGGPIPVEDIVAASPNGPVEAVPAALVALDDDDLIRIRDGQVDIAYPFSASPTPFVVRLQGGKERYACCAIDALGIAPLVGGRVEIRARCHHCQEALEFSAAPDRLGRGADGAMVWVGRRSEERCRVADSL